MDENELKELLESLSGTPEKVALDMAQYLTGSERATANTEDEFLQLYARCLKAAKGQRF